MANTPISGLNPGVAISDTDLFPDVQTVGVGPVKVTGAQIKTYTSNSPTLVTPNIGAATGTSLALGGATLGSNALAVTGTADFNSAVTLGTQQTIQGSLVLSNTAAGAFETTVRSSNSSSAAWTFTLPPSAGTNGYILTTNGSGVSAWTNPTALGIDLDIGSTAITGGTSTRVLYNNAGVLGEYSSVPVAVGGTGNTTNTQYGVLLGNGSNAINATSPGSNGQILQSKGASANPDWTTATFPGTATSTGTIIRADGTNWVSTTATYPTTTTINQILYSDANNQVTGLATGNGGILNTNSTGVPSITANPTLGVQQTTQGSIILANTAAGSFSTTLKSSNSASEAWTLTLPVSKGTNGYILTTDGAGVSSWSNPTSLGIDIDVNSTVITGGTNARLVYDNAGTFGEISSITTNGSNALTIGTQQSSQGSLILANTAIGAFSTTIQASNSASAAWTLTLPTTSGTSGYLLSTDGSGVSSWFNLFGTANSFTASQTFNAATSSIYLGANGGNLGIATLYGSTSGSVQVKSAAAAGTGTIFQLPSSNGTSNYVLTTDGAGVTSWAQVSLSAGVTGQLPLANGGTNANLTASDGGIFYSTASAGAILSGTATAGQILRSGANAAPSWSTATFPSIATGTGTILRADGTNWVASTATYPSTTTINQILYSDANNQITGLTTGNGGVLNTSSSGVPSITANPTLGVQQTTQGSLILANTAAGVFPVTVQSSNSTSAAWTLTLPTTAGTNNYILTTDGSGVSSWTNPTALGIDIDINSTAITGGNSGRILYNNAGTVGELTTTGSGSVVLATTPTFATSALFPDGSASAPSIGHSGDTNCGIFFPSSDVIGFSTAGSERMRWDSVGSVAIGITPVAGQSLSIAKQITGAVFAMGVRSVGVVQSDVTSQARGFDSGLTTAAASFTLGGLYHYYASPASFGLGSAVTNQVGFFAESTLTGATNNYGFYSSIASSTGRWNFYAAGTANNAYAGNSRFGGVTVPVATVDVTGSVAATTTILSSGATSGIGYATGAGGAVTQAISRTTGVTLNKISGQITLFSAAGSTTATTFTVTNSAVAATDVIHISQASGTNLYIPLITAVSASSFNVTFYTTGGTATDAPVFNFAVMKAVAA